MDKVSTRSSPGRDATIDAYTAERPSRPAPTGTVQNESRVSTKGARSFGGGRPSAIGHSRGGATEADKHREPQGDRCAGRSRPLHRQSDRRRIRMRRNSLSGDQRAGGGFLAGFVMRLVLVVLMCASAGVITTVQATPAAAAECSGSSCNGQDPQAKGCSSGASSVQGAAFWEASFSVELRHSPTCSARWTRLTVDDYLPTCCYAIRISIDRDLRTTYGWYRFATYQKKVASGLEGAFWTPMVQNSSDDRHRSCYRLEAMDGSWTGSWRCTGWY
ncbi:hypothetical protein QFZ76_003553 [Streptomyces sp. V4I2]|nr:hypothetical protein [Streptomyces sp. V4I2]